MKFQFRFVLSLVLCAGLLSTTSCRTYREGTITPERVKVVKENVFEENNLGELDKGAIENLVNDYARYGAGPMYVTVTYDPKSKNQTALAATKELSRISGELSRRGVQAKADIMPVKDSLEMKFLVSYDANRAKEPDCEIMSGYSDRDHTTNYDYKMGCTVETLMARQISRPGDLLGRAPANYDSSGRAASMHVGVYQAGEIGEIDSGGTSQ